MSKLDEVSNWMSKFRQVLNASKTQAIVFTNKGPPIQGSTPIIVKGIIADWREFALYLGVRFDRTLSWKPQFKHIVGEFGNRMDVLRKLCFSNFGLNEKVALTIYKGYIRPVVDYGCPAFITLKPYQFTKLQILQNQALRLCLRAPRDTPLAELHKRANIPFIQTHITSRTFDFVNRAMESGILAGQEAIEGLNFCTAEELEGTPLGAIRNLFDEFRDPP
jgi:hypothetical protein